LKFKKKIPFHHSDSIAMSANSSITPSTTSPSTMNTNLEPIDLLADFQKKLGLFYCDNQIYKVQISLKDVVNTIQVNDNPLFNNITRELNELKLTLNNISNDKSGQATLALDESGQATLALDESGQATLALDESGQATLALNKSITANKPNTDTTNTTGTTRQLTDYLCRICLDAPRDCLLEPCMHFCLCARCVNQLPESKCPICRRPIEFYQNVFIS